MKATGVSGGDQGRGKSRGIHMTEEEKGTPRRAAISTHPLWVSVQASTRLKRGGECKRELPVHCSPGAEAQKPASCTTPSGL